MTNTDNQNISQNDVSRLPAKVDAATAIRARQCAPILLCDRDEPFQPVAVALTHLKLGEPSPSYHHANPAIHAPTNADSILEYAIWWDGDIQHLYELEHVWIYLDENDLPVHVVASAHGKMMDMSQSGWQDRQVRIYCEPGKHAHASTSAKIIADKEGLDRVCTSGERLRGVLVQDFFARELAFLTPYDHFLGREYLKSLCFQPTYSFEKTFDLSKLPFLSWTEMRSYIPQFLREQTERLRREKTGIKAIFLDSGDTLIDEASQIHSEENASLVLSAKPIDTARQLVEELSAYGYPLALVADGLEQSFHNVLRANDLWDHFDAHIISENCGIAKPHARMFIEAMMALGLRKEDADGIIMMGNNLARDIRGANEMGIKSVWLDWVDRYEKTPKDDLEKPDFTIKKPIELLDVIKELEKK